MDPDGANVSMLDEAYYLSSPKWSPDGAQIAFGRLTNGIDDIWVMDSDGGNPTNLTNNPSSDISPMWYPDGSRLAFKTNREPVNAIYAMDADGGNQIKLTDDPSSSFFGERDYLSWAPDGRSITYSKKVDENEEVYVMQSNGATNQPITNNPARDYAPAYELSGSSICYLPMILEGR